MAWFSITTGQSKLNISCWRLSPWRCRPATCVASFLHFASVGAKPHLVGQWLGSRSRRVHLARLAVAPSGKLQQARFQSLTVPTRYRRGRGPWRRKRLAARRSGHRWLRPTLRIPQPSQSPQRRPVREGSDPPSVSPGAVLVPRLPRKSGGSSMSGIAGGCLTRVLQREMARSSSSVRSVFVVSSAALRWRFSQP